MAKKNAPKIHLIGNSHIDPVWLWRWQEGFTEILATYRSALDRMNDFPEFKFTSACAGYYEWVEKVDPEMFEEIRQRIAEGRWNVVGGWFLQPDCNIPDGESFARHGLVGQRYFQEKFGVTAKTGYNVDSFGHNASLPQILKKSGMDNYVFMRPNSREKEIPDEVFQWESADGSRVNAHRIPRYYNNNTAGNRAVNSVKELKERAEETGRDYMTWYGVGNHGGGPTISLINDLKNLEDPSVVFSTPDEYFAELDGETLPVVADELQHHARGCYSVCASVKTSIRKCENNLLTAEKLCTMAQYLIGAKYPKAKLKKAWKNLLFNEFHDITGGCSIKEAYEDAGYLFGETMSITEQQINYAMQMIAKNIDTLCGETLPAYRKDWKIWEHEVLGTPMVVFNPNGWTIRQPVKVNGYVKKVTDAEDREVPFQIVRGNYVNGQDEKYQSIFMAEVEPFGYAVYRFFLEKESRAEFGKEVSASDNVLENSKIRVEFSKLTGDICKLYDKQTQKYIIDGECKAILLDETNADTWAHDKVYLGEMVGMFDSPKFSVIEDGNVRATLRVTTRYNQSVLCRDYSILPDSDVVTVKVKIDFHEKHRTLKFTFPATEEDVISKIPYGTIRRKKGLGEEPCGSWIASGKVCVANDCKYGYDTTEDEMRLSILRSAIYADHFGSRDEFCEYMEQGEHVFTYQVFPYRGSAAAERQASELNCGLRALMGSFHNGTLPLKQSFFACDAENIILTAVKQAEDDEETILRFVEMDGKDGEATVHLFDKNIKVSVSHNEIKTFRADGTEVNLLEWKV